MRRRGLLPGMLALLALLAAAVCAGSPYVPAAQKAPEDIETIWAIEDAREESGVPLVTALEMNGVPLAYDAAENTFYCTLGLEDGEAWPELRLTAPGAKEGHFGLEGMKQRARRIGASVRFERRGKGMVLILERPA